MRTVALSFILCTLSVPVLAQTTTSQTDCTTWIQGQMQCRTTTDTPYPPAPRVQPQQQDYLGAFARGRALGLEMRRAEELEQAQAQLAQEREARLAAERRYSNPKPDLRGLIPRETMIPIMLGLIRAGDCKGAINLALENSDAKLAADAAEVCANPAMLEK